LLNTLYKNHGKYVSPVTNVTEENLVMGYILPEDADQTIEDAAHSSVGKKK
jgi:hypothetical protein